MQTMKVSDLFIDQQYTENSQQFQRRGEQNEAKFNNAIFMEFLWRMATRSNDKVRNLGI